MKGYKQLFSSRCCGGPILAMALLCIGFGIIFQMISAGLLGLVFLSVGLFTEMFCLYLGLRRCPDPHS